MEKYKVKIFDANKMVDKVIIFGADEEEDTLNELFEKEEIAAEQITQEMLIFSPVQIHQDDSIDQVKRKIINVIGCTYAELYLFCYKTRTINLMDALMKSTKSIITNKIFHQFLRNMDLEEANEEREIYEQKFLISLGFNKEETYSIKTSLGIEFNKGANYLFSTNPFLNDPEVMNNITTSPNEDKHLGKVDDNCIYACLAKDVFEHAEDLTEMYSRMYFPHLQAKNIFDLNDLNNKQRELQAETDSKMEAKYFNSYNIIDELYDIYYNGELLDVKEGIRGFTIEVMPNNKIHMPLDAIFKNINCTAEFPFIKYNPGKRRESICRLYSTGISKTGKKIPYLPKIKIISLNSITTGNKQISIYNSIYKILITIQSDGVINIIGKFKNGVKTTKQMEEIIKKSVNPLIDSVNHYLANSGYKLTAIESLENENINIVKMDYEFTTYLENKFIEIKKGNSITLNGKKYSIKEGIYSIDNFIQELMSQIGADGFSVSYTSNKLTFRSENGEFKMSTTIKEIGFGEKVSSLTSSKNSLTMPNNIQLIADMKLDNACIYPVFDVLVGDVKSGAVLQFKRVDNLKKMDSINSLIYNMLKKNGNPKDAYMGLVDQYGFEINDAKLLVSRVIESRDFMTKNPGLITTMKLTGNELKVVVNNLNNIQYTETLKIYLDSIIKITQELEVPNECNVVEKEEEKEKEKKIAKKNIDIRELILKEMEDRKREKKEEEEEEEEDEEEKEEKEEKEEEEAEIFGNDADSDYNPSTSDDEQSGGYKKSDFSKKLKEKDPDLYKSVKMVNGKEIRYSTSCTHQPVLITNKEKDEIDKKYRDSYGEALEYGSSKENKNWYICPQFWCFKTNTSMTKEQIDNGECGKTEKEKEENSFEFKDYAKKNEYNPGLISGKHKDENLCFPCCYKEWNSNKQKATQDKCKKHIEGEKPIDVATDKKGITQKILLQKTELKQGQWGHLPIQIRQFMRIKPEKKDDEFIFVRYGITKNLKQSLVGCLADVYARTQSPPSVISIPEMREKIANAVTPELFKKYGKGSFVSLFSKKNNDDAYTNFRNYLLDENSIIDHTYLWDIVSTDGLFEDGLNMVIMDIVNNDITDKVDVICPLTSYVKNFFDINRKTIFLIKNGSLYEPVYYVKKSNKDGTAESLFDTKNRLPNITSLLEHLENTLNKSCVSEYVNSPMKITDLIRFLEKTKGYKIEKQVVNYQERTIALLVKTPSKKHIYVPCEPSEQQDEYPIIEMDDPSLWCDFETTLRELMKLKIANPSILCQPKVKIYDKGIIIGFLTETNQFIKLSGDPAENMVQDEKSKDDLEVGDGKDPYEIEMSIQNTRTDDPTRVRAVQNIQLESNFYSLYRSTIKTLLENDNESRNQIIAIIENEDSVSKEKLKEIMQTVRNNKMDCKPIIAIINDVNLSYKDKLKKTMQIVKDVVDISKYENEEKYIELSYKEKLNKVVRFIQTITEDVVIYAKMSPLMLSEVSYTCEKQGKSGLYKDGCQLIVPQKNLVSKKENSEIYPQRIADEIVRFGQIQNFLLKSNQFLNFGNVNYKINSDEFIIGKTNLSENYFDDLINQNNEYLPAFNSVNGIPYDMAKTKLYSPRDVKTAFAEAAADDTKAEAKAEAKAAVAEVAAADESDCAKENPFRDQTRDKPDGKGQYWGKLVFPNETEIIKFTGSAVCSFGPLIYIMERVNNKKYGIDELKDMLWIAYRDYIVDPENKKKIVKILGIQGKRGMINGTTDFETVLKSEEYYMTTLDIWVFAQKYNVPIILFSSDNIMKDVSIEIENKLYNESIKNTEYSNSWIILGGNVDDRFFFYESAPDASRYQGVIRPQRLIKQSFYRTELNDLSERVRNIFAMNKVFSFADYLQQ